MVITKNNYLNFNAILLITFINSSLYTIYNQFNNIKLEAVYNYTTFTNIFVFCLGLYSLKNIVNLYIKTKKNYFIEKDINEDIQDKLSASLYSFIYHTVSVIIMYYHITNSKWYINNDILYINVESYTNTEVIIYNIQIAHYVSELYYFKNKKIKRKDDNELFIHHIATLILICGSYYYKFLQSGMFVMYLHDINDIFMHLSKVLVYLKYTEKITNVTFGVFILSWFYTRLYLLPNLIISYFKQEFYTTFMICLIILYILNLYWFKLIIHILIKKLVSNKLEDIRE